MDVQEMNILPEDHAEAILVGRIWNPDVAGPSLVRIDNGQVFDITSTAIPTMRDLLEQDDPVDFIQGQQGRVIGTVEELSLIHI